MTDDEATPSPEAEPVNEGVDPLVVSGKLLANALELMQNRGTSSTADEQIRQRIALGHALASLVQAETARTQLELALTMTAPQRAQTQGGLVVPTVSVHP